MAGKSDKEYQKIKQRIFDFLWNEVDPMIPKSEANRSALEKELFPRFKDMGMWGLLIPEEYGGMGLSTRQYLPIIAETSKVGLVVRGPIHVHNSGARSINVFGTKEQKKKYLPAAATGEKCLAFALTEANAGTGMDIKTTAVRKGDYYIINGEKHLISNSSFAHWFSTVCWTDKSLGRKGLSSIMVERDTPGFTLKPMNHPMGGELGHGIGIFKDAKVPVTNIVGKEGEGIESALGELEPSRLFVAASSLGTAERALEIAADYSKKRITFGKPIATRQAILTLLADMAKDILALKLLLEKCADLLDQGKPCPLEASICKLFGLEAVMRVTDKAMEVLGGRAYIADYPYPLERIYREARINALEEGTPSVQRLVIGREVLQEKMPFRIGTLED